MVLVLARVLVLVLVLIRVPVLVLVILHVPSLPYPDYVYPPFVVAVVCIQWYSLSGFSYRMPQPRRGVMQLHANSSHYKLMEYLESEGSMNLIGIFVN